MLDRLEMSTDLQLKPDENGNSKFDSFNGKYKSKLLEEDDDRDIKELKISSGGLLYKNLFVLTNKMNKKTGEVYEDPIKFYVFGYPNFKRNSNNRFKIVCNPSNVPINEIIDFLYENFQFHGKPRTKDFYDNFHLGRVDFAIDIPDFSVDEIRRMIYLDTKVRKHISIFNPAVDAAGYLRIISSRVPETVYIGKSQVVLRIYDKVKEVLNQIAVCKREGRIIPERLKRIADLKQLTRIEMQIRSISTSGLSILKDSKGERLNKKEKRGFHSLKTFNDILSIKEKQCDIFSDCKFSNIENVNYFDADYMNRAFTALINEVGFDEAVKNLPIRKRQEIKNTMLKKSFNYDLNKKLFQEVKQWLMS